MEERFPKDGLPILSFEAPHVMEAWLEVHHASSAGIWIKFAKKAAHRSSVTYEEALDLALCFGWIDGQLQTYDAEYFLRRFTPRRARSKWSKINVEKAEGLIREGKMHPTGQAQVDAARADGRWEAAYASQRIMPVPPDLQERLDADPRAQAFFDTLTSANRYAVLYRIADAKKPETRARRIDQFMAMLAEGRTLY